MISLILVAALALPLNPDVTPQTIDQTICVPGWTKTVRPPVSFTNKVKKGLMAKAGIPWSKARNYELDHILSLELGGLPRDPRNLQLQPWAGPAGAHAKDAVENWLHKQVCLGNIPLAAAQDCLFNRWQQCRKEFSK